MTSGADRRAEILPPRARRLLPIFLVLLIALSLRQLVCAPASTLVTIHGSAMGTSYTVSLHAPGLSPDEHQRAEGAVAERLEGIDRRMSTYAAESELSRFNRHASTRPFPMSTATLEVFRVAREVSERSGGALDVTVRPLVSAWGFGATDRAPGAPPDAAELAELRERVGYELLEIGTDALVKRRPQVEADLSAVAKGYAVDEVARSLEGLGFEDFLVEVGGEVRARGVRPDGGAWRLAIERPDAEGRVVHVVVPLEDRAMATSGDYRSYYDLDGERVSHILDPRSGRPIRHRLASVSVVHPEAVYADAWATALLVLGAEQGLPLAERFELAAYFILRGPQGDFETRATRHFPAVEPVSGASP